MKLRTLSIFEFEKFAKEQNYNSYLQTPAYGIMMCENKYDYEIVGMINDKDEIVASALILFKRITLFTRYGYAPGGFIIDYTNLDLVKEFCNLLKKRYYRKNFAFIKINPEIIVNYIDIKKKELIPNNPNIIKDLENIGFKKLKDNKYFESLMPKFNALLNIKEFSINKADKRTRNKIRKSLNKGFSIEVGSREDIKIIYNFFKNKKSSPLSHYYKYYNSFSKNNNIDIFLVKINFEKALIATRKAYEKELEINNKLVQKFIDNNTNENLNRKMDSDQKLNTYTNEISDLTKFLNTKTDDYVAGAIVIKSNNRVSILISGYDKKYKQFCPNYYLHYQIIEYYKDNYEYLDLNGLTGDFSNENPYKGLNEFKLGFNPTAYELIGELDLVINESMYKNIDMNGLLLKEFDRSNVNKPAPKIIEPIKKEEPKKIRKSIITITR